MPGAEFALFLTGMFAGTATGLLICASRLSVHKESRRR